MPSRSAIRFVVVGSTAALAVAVIVALRSWQPATATARGNAEEVQPIPVRAAEESTPSAGEMPQGQVVALRAMAAAMASTMLAPPSAQDAGSALLDEASLMAELREMRLSDPDLTLRLAREGNERFPDSADAAERASFAVRALMRTGRTEEAVAEAKAMVAKYGGTAWAIDVKHHMLDIPSYVPDGATP